ncbi:MAG: ATP-binding protein [Acidobacteriota bacterium]
MTNYFRTFKIKVLLQIILICINICINIYLFFQYQNILLAAGFFIILIYQIVILLRFMDITNRDFKRFLEAIEYSDFTQSFTDKKMGKSFLELNSAFNKVLEKFKQNRSEKEKSFRYMQTIIQYIHNGLISYDQQGNVDFINRAGKKILNLSFLKNINSLKISHPDIYELIMEIRHGDKIVKKVNINDEQKQMAFSVFEFRIGERNLTLLSIQDIHNVLEEKELEAWQKLIRVLTHEIMNSLTPISSLSSTTFDLIKQLDIEPTGPKDNIQDIRDALNTIHTRSEGLIDFVNAYRNLAIIPKPVLKILSVKDLISNSLTILQNNIKENDIEVIQNIDPESLEISADSSLIEQVLINLIINAVQALKEAESRIIIVNSFLSDSGKVIIQVIDNGSGISDQNKSKIFIPFYSTKKSSGIGLSLCKQIMKLHKGQINVTSIDGLTTFTLGF